MKKVYTVWEIWVYDVWGNAHDGYDVNDRCCIHRAYPLRLRVQKYNPGTDHEFLGATPSDRQIRDALGIRCQFDVDGDDISIYVTRTRDGFPIGEMYCTSHSSLSPIQEAKASPAQS